MLYGELPEVTLPNGERASAVKISVPNPPKVAFLALPSGDQISARMAREKTIRCEVEPGKTKSTTESDLAADLDLFRNLRLDKDGAAFDEYESSRALDKLTSSWLVDSTRDGNQYLVTLGTIFGEVKHRIGIPTERDMAQYRRAIGNAYDARQRSEEFRLDAAAIAKLYDGLAASIEGYAPGYQIANVPPNHKAAVFTQAIEGYRDLDLSLDPNS